MDIRSTLESYTKDQLIEMLLNSGVDRAFGVMTRNMAETFHGTIDADKDLIFLDIANMHAMNHLYGMDGVDSRIKNVTDAIRHSDLVVRWGGDEIVILVNSGSIAVYVNRLIALMEQNDLYGVMTVVKTSTSLAESVKRASDHTMQVKDMIDQSGRKPSRDAGYIRLDSVVEYV